MDAEAIALAVALGEEQGRREEAVDADRPRRELIVIEREDVTTADAFNIKEAGTSFPVAGPGTLDAAVVIASANDFEVYLEVDGQTVIDETFDTLSDRASELNRISAYERTDGKFVVSAQDYEFQAAIDIVITPTATVTFDLQRAEVDVFRGH